MSFDPHALKIYIDGSCFNNPGGNGGFAAIVEYPSTFTNSGEWPISGGATVGAWEVGGRQKMLISGRSYFQPELS